MPPNKSPVKTKQIVFIADMTIAFNWIEYVQLLFHFLFLLYDFTIKRLLMRRLKCIVEKDGSRVQHEVWSLTVMIPFNPHYVLVTCVNSVHLLSMYRSNEIISFCYNEHCWHEAGAHVLDGVQEVNVHPGSA